MGFLNTDSMPRLVEKLADGDNIKITGNSKGNRVGTVVKKIVEKADEVTKAIEQEVVNDSYSFKVGTGDVDVSADVEDGFGEVGIKGVTYQNLLGTLVAVGKEWVESDNKYTLNLPSGSGQPQIRYNLAYPLKPNTKYTLICEIKEYTVGYPHFCFMTKDNRTLASTTEFTPNSVGIKTAILTTKSDADAELLRILPRANIDNIYSIGKNIILLEGDHTNNPNLPSYFEGIVGVGDKSKNLFNITNSTIGKYLQGNIGSGYGTYGESSVSDISDYIPVAANKTYVFSYDFKELLGTGDRGYCFYNENKELITSNKNTLYSSTSKKLILTPSVNGYVRVCYDKNCLDIQLEEGSTVTSYEPYYDGHKIEILSNGKNLWNGEFEVGSIDTVTGLDNTIGVNRKRSFFIRVTPNTKYMIKQYDYKDSNDAIFIHQYTLDKQPIAGFTGIDSSKFTLWTSNDTHFIKFRTQNERDLKYNSISITQEEKDTEFCEYVSDKTQILLDEPLMRLPNGTCDEITRDGKLIRRVGKKFIDANISGLAHNGTSSNHNQFVIHKGVVTPNSINHANLLCDKKPCKVDNSGNNSVWVYNKATLVFQMDSTINSVEKMRQWLSQNPTTVYYELAEPIITELPAPYLRIFKDGHLTFNTLVAPESNHVVQLNKSAQIERSIREVQSLDSRVGKLESFYDDMMLETSHKLSLLNYDFEYTRESEDI